MDKKTIVPLEGITHVVVEKDVTGLSENENKLKARKILEELDLIKEPASGVMFISKKDGQIFMQPIVWIRDLKTLYYETACGSGTIAVGLFQSKKNGVSNGSIVQPSGMKIDFSVNDGRVKISGKILKIEKDLVVEI